jgi:hypothetical protein
MEDMKSWKEKGAIEKKVRTIQRNPKVDEENDQHVFKHLEIHIDTLEVVLIPYK